MLKTRFALLFFIFLFLFFSIPVKATTLDYTSVIYDATVYQYQPTSNFGFSNLAYRNWANYEYRIYMMWDLSDIPANATITDAYISLYRWGSGTDNKIINATVWNTTFNWTETNITWNTIPATSVNTDNASAVTVALYGRNNFTVKNALQYAVNNNLNLSIMIKDNRTLASGFIDLSHASKDSATASANKPLLVVTYSVADCGSSCGDCGCAVNSTECYVPPIIGSYCDYSGSSNGGVKTVLYSNCTNTTYFQCPNNTFCSQITPAINVSEYLSQGAGGMLEWCRGCWFINYRPDPIFHYNTLAVYSTNCWNTTSTPYTVYDECNCNQIGYCSSDIYETDNITSVPYSITQWTAGCFNPATGKYSNVINSTGSNTTIETMINKTCPNCTLTNNITSNCLSNTTTTCYDSSCNIVPCGNIVSTTCNSNYGGQIALSVGGLMGITDCGLSLNILSIIISLMLGFTVLWYTKESEQASTAFIIGILAPLTMFSLINWFPVWLIVILITISGYLIARTMGYGGGG